MRFEVLFLAASVFSVVLAMPLDQGSAQLAPRHEEKGAFLRFEKYVERDDLTDDETGLSKRDVLTDEEVTLSKL